jgi:hypothetical protein
MGYAGGLVSLVIVLGFLAADPRNGRTYFGLAPLRPRSGRPRGRPHHRALLGPVVPRLRDAALPVHPRCAAHRPLLREAARGPRAGAEHGGGCAPHPGVLRFLLANMVYQDALVALFAFGGIYGAGVFGWGRRSSASSASCSPSRAPPAPHRRAARRPLGAKPVILGAIGLLTLVCIGVLSLGREHISSSIPTAPPAPGTGSTAACRKSSSSGSALSSARSRVPSRRRRAACSPGSCRRGGGALFRPLALSGSSRRSSRRSRCARDRCLRHAGRRPAVLIAFFASAAAAERRAPRAGALLHRDGGAARVTIIMPSSLPTAP